MKYIFAFTYIVTMIWLVTLAFPQNGDRSREIFANSSDAPSTSTQMTTNCPCIATAEYNPICGSDNVTYWNMGRFICAKQCNPQLEIRVMRACEPYSTISNS